MLFPGEITPARVVPPSGEETVGSPPIVTET
jgi:hypothetical protein